VGVRAQDGNASSKVVLATLKPEVIKLVEVEVVLQRQTRLAVQELDAADLVEVAVVVEEP
jgi:hypothetical protein